MLRVEEASYFAAGFGGGNINLGDVCYALALSHISID